MYASSYFPKLNTTLVYLLFMLGQIDIEICSTLPIDEGFILRSEGNKNGNSNVAQIWSGR
jgi:hypothetical protein